MCRAANQNNPMGVELDTTTERSENLLSLDLEAGVKDRRIHAFAAIRPDRGQPLALRPSSGNLAAALAKLDDFADGADLVLGHNLIDFDLPILRATNPNLRLLSLPAVDTLRLNPLAFPRNPYHHLVKHYQDGQLKRGRINNPETGCQTYVRSLSPAAGSFPPDIAQPVDSLALADHHC